MKKRWWVLIGILIVIFILVIFFILLSIFSPMSVWLIHPIVEGALKANGACELLPQTEQNCFIECVTEYPRADCYKGIVLKSGNYSNCENYKNVIGFTNDSCYENFAYYTHDIGACKLISLNSTEREDCFYGQAKEANDPYICEYLSGEIDSFRHVDSKEECYAGLAITAADSTGNISFCDTINQSFKDSCIQAFAKSSYEPDNCAKINDINESIGCYSSAALYRKDASICDNIKQITGGYYSRDSCYIDYIYFSLDNNFTNVVNICEKVSDNKDEEYSRNGCYYKMAYTKKDLQLCGKINDKSFEYKCINNVNSIIDLDKKSGLS